MSTMPLPLAPESPRFLFLQLNQRCNLKCTHCVFYKLNDDDRAQYLPLDRRLSLMSEFKMLGGETLVTCGGEPMLDVEDYFAAMRGAQDRGLKAFSVINGTKVSTEAMADRMMDEGPSEITVSLDGHTPEINDKHRGVKGAFRAATRALRLLLEARQRSGIAKPIYAMTIVCEDTWRHLDAFYNLILNEIGADKLKLNIMQPSFGLPGDDHYFSSQLPRDVAGVMANIRACDAKYALRLNPAWLEQVEMYFRSAGRNGRGLSGWTSGRGTEYPICNTYDRNIMVDVWGGAKLCFSEAFPGMSVREPGSLRRFWEEFRPKVKPAMLGCTKYCGISHSVRRESATRKTAAT